MVFAYGNNKMSKSMPVPYGFPHIRPQGNWPLITLTRKNPGLITAIGFIRWSNPGKREEYTQRQK